MSDTTIYDASGRPTAYIASDGKTIYTWGGHAVAQVVNDKVWGWNGTHLGWMRDGRFYDQSGFRIGFLPGRSPVATHASPAKSAKHARHARYARQAAYARPGLSPSTSSKPLLDWLGEGAVGGI